MKFYNSKTASLMSELRKYAAGDMDLVERAMVKTRRDKKLHGQLHVSIDDVKACIDELQNPPKEKIPA